MLGYCIVYTAESGSEKDVFGIKHGKEYALHSKMENVNRFYKKL